MIIGLLADTHGKLHPAVTGLFDGVDHIIHAGDIGEGGVLRALREIAPVTYVLGNNDDSDGYGVIRVTLEETRFLITHILPRPHALGDHVRRSLRAQKPDVVVFGHSHLPHDEVVDGIRFFNPASAGRRRFDYPLAVGIGKIVRGRCDLRHVPLDERSVGALRKTMNQLR